MKKILEAFLRFTLIVSSVVVAVISLFWLYVLVHKATKSKYNGPQYSTDVQWMIDDFTTQWCKTHNAELIDIGNFREKSSNIEYGFWLRSYSSQPLPEAQHDAKALVASFWNMLENDKRTLVYFEKTKRTIREHLREKLSVGLVGVKIAYWDKDENRPLPPYVAEVVFYDNTFYYYQADPETQALKLILVEPYNEAITSQTKERFTNCLALT